MADQFINVLVLLNVRENADFSFDSSKCLFQICWFQRGHKDQVSLREEKDVQQEP